MEVAFKKNRYFIETNVFQKEENIDVNLSVY